MGNSLRIVPSLIRMMRGSNRVPSRSPKELINSDGSSDVYDVIVQNYVVGRFGWKANVGTLTQQTAGAYNGDMGVTSSTFPAENCEAEFAGCARHGPEVSDDDVNAVAFYTATLGVPARRNLNDPVARTGEAAFLAAGTAMVLTHDVDPLEPPFLALDPVPESELR